MRRLKADPPGEDVARLMQTGFRLFDQKKDRWKKILNETVGIDYKEMSYVTKIPLMYKTVSSMSVYTRGAIERCKQLVDPSAVFIYTNAGHKIAIAAACVKLCPDEDESYDYIHWMFDVFLPWWRFSDTLCFETIDRLVTVAELAHETDEKNWIIANPRFSM